MAKKTDILTDAKLRGREAFGMRWGRVLGAIATARHALALVNGERTLFGEPLDDEVREIYNRLASLEHNVWKEWEGR